LNILCPKHRNEVLRVTRYSKLLGKKGDRYATSWVTGWLYCEKCDKMYKPKMSFKVSLR
jgi:hypothetical protein